MRRRARKASPVLAVAPDHVVEGPVERAEHRRVPRHEARLGERGAGDDVAAGLLEALRQGPEAVSDRQADVPEELQHLLHEAAHPLRRAALVQEEQVHVGERRELRAPVAAERHHRAPGEGQPGLDVRLRQREPAGVGHHLVHLVAAGRGDLEPPQSEPVPHPQAVGLELDEALEVGEPSAGVRRAAFSLQALLRVGLDLLAVDPHGVGSEEFHDACRGTRVAASGLNALMALVLGDRPAILRPEADATFLWDQRLGFRFRRGLRPAGEISGGGRSRSRRGSRGRDVTDVRPRTS